MSEIVCIDSMVFVWGIKQHATKGQEHMIDKTMAFLDWLDTSGKKIILPAPIITEILAPVDDTGDRDKFMDLVYKRFRIAPYDDLAARKGGEIWNTHKNYKEYYQEGGDGLKNRFKYDILILAIAIVQKVECLYTEDEALLKLAAATGLKASKIPSIAKQSTIDFKQNESEEKA